MSFEIVYFVILAAWLILASHTGGKKVNRGN